MSLESQVTELVNATNQLLNRVTTQADNWDAQVQAKINELEQWRQGVEGRFIKGMVYREFDTPIEIPGTDQYHVMLDNSRLNTDILEHVNDPLGLANNWKLKNPFEYTQADDYSPQKVVDGEAVNCFATINIHNFPICSDTVYLVLKTVVEGHPNNTQYTPIDVIKYDTGSSAYWEYPDHYNRPYLLIHGTLVWGRNWGWNYRDTCILKTESLVGYGTSYIRIINRGDRKLTLFGLGFIFK